MSEAIVPAVPAANILAEPNLTALSGETASFLAGGEFPIPVAQDENSITIEFKEFGVSLSFTPTIIGDAKVSMRVRPEVSALSTEGAIITSEVSVPALTTRRAETTVELGSGQSFAIAGLILDQTRQAADQYPGLADLPIIGALFQSDEFSRRETELVIVVTPYIVKPGDPGQLQYPNEPFQARQDEGALPNPAAASLQTVPLQKGVGGSTGTTKPVGFIIE